jgi:hypothetical protein
LLQEPGAQLPVEADGGPVPVEHRPLHPPAPPPHRDAGQRAQQRQSSAASPRLGQHEEVLQPQRRPRQERGVGEGVQRQAHRPPVHPRDQRLEVSPRPEPMPPDRLHRRGPRQPLVVSKPMNQRRDHPHIPPRPTPNADPRATHASQCLSSDAVSTRAAPGAGWAVWGGRAPVPVSEDRAPRVRWSPAAAGSKRPAASWWRGPPTRPSPPSALWLGDQRAANSTG